MAKFTVEPKRIKVGGQDVVIRALTARERQAIASRCKTGDEMTAEAVFACAADEDGEPFFADLAEVLDAPCGYISAIGEKILELSGMDTGQNPT